MEAAEGVNNGEAKQRDVKRAPVPMAAISKTYIDQHYGLYKCD